MEITYHQGGVGNPSNALENSKTPCTSSFTGRVPILNLPLIITVLIALLCALVRLFQAATKKIRNICKLDCYVAFCR